MGGYKPGSVVPDPSGKEGKALLRFGRPKVWAPAGGQIYELRNPLGPFRQYLMVAPGNRVTVVAREFPEGQIEKLYAALLDKYGDPVTANPMPGVKSAIHPFGGTIKVETKALFRDRACGLDIEFIKQGRTTIVPFGGGSEDLAAIVVSKTDTTPAGDSTLLK